MKTNGFEKKVLDKMAESLVVNISELFAATGAKNKKDKTEVENAIKVLIEKQFITPIYSSQTTFAITQSGVRTAKK